VLSNSSTHDINLAYEWADELIMMNSGKIMAHGFPDVIFQDEDMLQIYQQFLHHNYLKRQPMIPRTKEELFKLIK